jgi:DNA-binding GntR family transcriptional regulator
MRADVATSSSVLGRAAAGPGRALFCCGTLICSISDIKLINTTTVRAQTANELRDRILTGRLQPGDRLDLDQLTAEFGISRTPIREALLELSYEGLVAITPRSGMAVVGITPQDAVDNFAILAALAGMAAEMATARITAAELAELRDLAAAIDGADDVVAANRRFHRAVNYAARSPRLLTHIRQAVRVVPGNYFELFPEQEQRSKREHAALLRAVASDDGKAARRLAEAHVLAAGRALGGWLAGLAAQGAPAGSEA